MKKFIFLMLAFIISRTSLQAQFASQKLDNLTKSTAVNQSLLPKTDNLYSLGSTGHSLEEPEPEWHYLY